MTKEKLYEALGGIDEKYVKEARECQRAKKPGWFKGGVLAACLCLAALGSAAVWQLAADRNAVQPGRVNLVVNEVENGTQLDMDVKISHYTDASGEEWEAAMEAFGQATGMSYEEFTKKLPASYRQTAFYSVDAPAVPKSGEYVPHDYVLEFLTKTDGKVKISICAEEEPLRDCFFLCEDPKESKVNGTAVLVYSVQGRFMAQFSHGAVQYDIDAQGIPLEELEDLLACILDE